jgi:Flp pilus assembly protein TadG
MRVTADDRGSSLILVLGFYLIAFTMVAGTVAAGDAFLHQQRLQNVCDGAAAAAAATALDLNRGAGLAEGTDAVFAGIQRAVDAYLARDPERSDVRVTSTLSTSTRTLTLRCAATTPIVFGGMFGQGQGVRHTATSSARAPLT